MTIKKTRTSRKTRVVTLHRTNLEEMKSKGLSFTEMGLTYGLPTITIQRFYKKVDYEGKDADKYKRDSLITRTTYPDPKKETVTSPETISEQSNQQSLPLRSSKRGNQGHLLGTDLKEALQLVFEHMEGSGISLITITPEGKVTVKRHSEGVIQL